LKNCAFIFLLAIVSGCGTDTPQFNTELDLEYNIGTVRVNLPERFDCFNKYYKLQDMGCCGNWINYRYYSCKDDNFPVMDTVPWYTPNFDFNSRSRYSFSVSIKPKCCREEVGDTLYSDWHYNFIDNFSAERPNLALTIEDYCWINGQPYSIVGYTWNGYGKVHEHYVARTIYNNSWIKFEGNRMNTDSSNFVNEIHEIVKSITFELPDS